MLAIGFAFTLVLFPSFAQNCDPRCETNKCNENGDCICDLPDPSTVLNGDRTYLGGEFCNREQTMCDGSNNFWCDHGSSCNEIVQGERYTCLCPKGHSGEHCEAVGVPCGDSFCYHGADCLKTDILCGCLPDWRGSDDCSLPTRKSTFNQTSNPPQTTATSGENKWFVPLFSVVVGVAVVLLIVVLGRKLYMERTENHMMQFQNIQRLQMSGILDDDDDAFSHKPLTYGGEF
eukprot:c39051_g1_i1 orf=1142-1837(-)